MAVEVGECWFSGCGSFQPDILDLKSKISGISTLSLSSPITTVHKDGPTCIPKLPGKMLAKARWGQSRTAPY